jgi:hypothetical protein
MEARKEKRTILTNFRFLGLQLCYIKIFNLVNMQHEDAMCQCFLHQQDIG